MDLALDTHTYSALARGKAEVLEAISLADRIFMPVPVLAELRAAFLAGDRGKANDAVLAKFLASPRVEVLCCDAKTAQHYAALKVQLRMQGTPIPINDIWIAALVLQHDTFLYSYDSDFDKIPQLPRFKA